MSKLYVRKEKIIKEPTIEELKKLLCRGEYIICADLKDKNDLNSMVLENVICKKGDMYITYGVSQSDKMEYFRLHDDFAISGRDVDTFLYIFSQNFDLFLINDNNLDKKNIYGKLGTANENKVVFRF